MRIQPVWPALLLALWVGHADATAQPTDPQVLLQSLHIQQGTVDLPGAQAHLALKPGYGFLPAAEAQRVLHELWGNPPGPAVLGMVLPGTEPQVLLDPSSWAVVVTYVDEGHVADDEVNRIDYSQMLEELQQQTRQANPERLRQGYPAVQLNGWAEPPHYDAASHKLYWARDLGFQDAEGRPQGRTLNYDIRVLGRSGYLSLNAVAPIEQLAKVRRDMPQVLAMTEFEPGQRYQDFDRHNDRLATYGIGALIAGGAAAKLGLFAKLGMLLLAMKKFLIAGVLAIGALARKLLNRQRR